MWVSQFWSYSWLSVTSGSQGKWELYYYSWLRQEKQEQIILVESLCPHQQHLICKIKTDVCIISWLYHYSLQMLQVVVLLVIVVATRGHRMPYIIGGDDVQVPGTYPWQGSLTFLGSHSCGCVLLTDQWVLTAGHCIIATSYVYSNQAWFEVLYYYRPEMRAIL